MCFDRIKLGKLPACVEACPGNALAFGERAELLALARQGIQNHPDRYVERVWGEEEYGGTSILYISDVDLDAIGWPDGASTPIPDLTKPLISKTPFIGVGVASCLLGLNWIVQRRMKLADEAAMAGRTGSPEEDGSDA
jgi:hypothetical protein